MNKMRHNNFPFDPAKSPVFYGWFIILWGTLGVIMSIPGQTMGVSTFTDHLIDALNLSRNQLSTAYLLGTISSSFMLTKAGKWYDKIGARWLGGIITITLGCVLIYLSQVDRIAFSLGRIFQIGDLQFYLSFFIIMLGFFLLRFSGQGVLTMLSRNMMMKWFDRKRGLVNGISSVFVSVGFAISPLVFDYFIETYSWRWAWIFLALIAGFGFSLVVLIFFRDNPEDCGLEPDGESVEQAERRSKIKHKAVKQFTLKEAQRSFPFWVLVIALSMQALYITGFTFNIVSIFESASMDKTIALAVFVPTSVISVFISLAGGWLSDHIKMKYLLLVFLVGQMISMVSLALLSPGVPYVFLIIGNGIVGGLFSVLSSVVWPRFYGRQHLGAISGFAMSALVFFSALGPLMFSFSFTRLGGYSWAAYICLFIVVVNFFAALKADNPQEKLSA
ncbi:MFS transporter [Sunxiuqinia indica]|uniref:MFS transporter n=1 Tax=Sunxiuqinia indica TaxID=2692584 RepID=UPI00135B2C58|nr:MFS transporter [Sunxiuqinia indica]